MEWTSDLEPLVPCVASTDVRLPGAIETVTGLPGVVRMVADAILPTLV
jgi:hypothetical protein